MLCYCPWINGGTRIAIGNSLAYWRLRNENVITKNVVAYFAALARWGNASRESRYRLRHCMNRNHAGRHATNGRNNHTRSTHLVPSMSMAARHDIKARYNILYTGVITYVLFVYTACYLNDVLPVHDGYDTSYALYFIVYSVADWVTGSLGVFPVHGCFLKITAWMYYCIFNANGLIHV